MCCKLQGDTPIHFHTRGAQKIFRFVVKARYFGVLFQFIFDGL